MRSKKTDPDFPFFQRKVDKYRSKQAAQMATDSLKAAGLVRDYFIANCEKQ
ncbi:hypothetical protein L0337_02865 [candidate division KSB1 bacterium]|nr:hypothetical protein [candidate division KSB1 bacterium]